MYVKGTGRASKADILSELVMAEELYRRGWVVLPG